LSDDCFNIWIEKYEYVDLYLVDLMDGIYVCETDSSDNVELLNYP